MTAALVEPAFAKVNLTLRISRRRADGYHDLDSMVVFAQLADELRLEPGVPLSLSVSGPTAGASGAIGDNLVLKAAHALAKRVQPLTLGAFTLRKRLPVAAGLGGGSADAAAALRLLARANSLAPGDPRIAAAAAATGADVPVCLDPRPRRMQGIGERLSPPLLVPDLPAVLVNPRVGVSTKDVFARVRLGYASQTQPANEETDIIAEVIAAGNDLEPPAIALTPVIADVLAALRAQAGCRLARMSGSGATCFGLFVTRKAATAAATALRREHAGWWVRNTILGSPLEKMQPALT